MQVSDESSDRPPSSDFVTRAELRAHLVTIQKIFFGIKG